MQTYASKYINITNMTSASKDKMERICRASLESLNPSTTKFCGHEYQLNYIWICNDAGQGEIENHFMTFPEEGIYVPTPTICKGLEVETGDTERLFGKVVVSLKTDLDLVHLIPNLEPQFCLFAFEEFDIYDNELFYHGCELFVREDHLQSPEGRVFGREVLQAKLKGEIV